MHDGVVPGGWGEVIAAFSITAGVLILYGWSLIRRIRQVGSEEI